MSEQLPAPDFDAQNYARPNQDWICGHAGEGKPCPLGPDRAGRCQATFECRPVLEKKPGETKGRWRCTRADGECEPGPLPDGTCCRAIPKCSPAPTMRLRRGRCTRAVVAASIGGLLILLGRASWRAGFINPGEVSRQHSSQSFAQHYGDTNTTGRTCAACHRAGNAGPGGLVAAAFGASPGPFEFVKLAQARNAEMTAIDEACQQCHLNHTKHQPDVVREISCAYCHREHQGVVMPWPTEAQCAFCHGNAGTMAAAAAKGRQLPPDAFHLRVKPGENVFEIPRPAGGFTEVIHTFAGDHPEFRLRTDHHLHDDPDTLKFNHRLHLTSATVTDLAPGGKLYCASCHQPDASGAYYRKISFEADCRGCHSLQFDAENPGLRLPHGNAEYVRAFLRSLPAQYAEYARRVKNLTAQDEVNTFAQQQMARLRDQVGSGEELEREIFFSDAHTAPVTRVAGMDAQGRARFPGCAYCHEVTANGEAAPQITKPVIMDRWLARARFNHAKHTQVACEKCHDARDSADTADVLMPGKASCVTCHSPQGGVASNCSECHQYHAPGR